MSAALPAVSLAQQAPAAPQAKPDMQEVQGWLTELQQLHTRLEGIQQKALADPQISAAQTTLGGTIKAAMAKIDPGLEQSMARMQTLEGEATTAQQAKDQAKLQQIGAEAQKIQEQFISAQQK